MFTRARLSGQAKMTRTKTRKDASTIMLISTPSRILSVFILANLCTADKDLTLLGLISTVTAVCTLSDDIMNKTTREVKALQQVSEPEVSRA